MRSPGDGDQTTIERYDPLVGSILDQRFRIDYQLAAGGFGAIYRATDIRSDAEVALKVLLPQLAGDPMVVARFRREGKTLANLRDPHTITAYELGEAPDGTLYIVMELLHGVSLYERFRTYGQLPWRRVLHIAQGVCSSLAEAHAVGIVHRDLKPANIHLETRGNDPDFVKVLDFGIAKIVQGNGNERSELTQVGQMIGTVDYMSPEQMVGGEMTPASDIYTLGVVLYELLTGRTPFAEAQTPTAILAAVLTTVPEPVSRYADVPTALDPILARCLERDPPARYADVTEVADALAEVAAAASRPSLSVERRDRPPPPPANHPGFPAVPPVTPSTFPPLLERPMSTPASAPAARYSQPSIAPSVAPPIAPGVTPSGTPMPETSGFEDNSLTMEATRIDVRISDSSRPVLDARGPRVRSDALGIPTPLIPGASQPVIAGQGPLAGPARGSQQAIDGRAAPTGSAAEWQRGSIDGWQVHGPPGSDGRTAQGQANRQTSQPVIDLAAWHRQQAVAARFSQPPGGFPQPAPTPGQAPYGYLQAARVEPPPSYDMLAAAKHDAMVRRIIWLVLFVLSTVITLLLTR